MVGGSTPLRLTPDLVTVAGSDTIRSRVLRPPTCNACPLTHAGFRLIPFRSPLLGESRLISFPRGTEMFQFPRLPSIAYVFSDERRRITGAGLPHSEIRGSMPVQRLTAAYRSRPRPSSTPDAKASTVCPYYLDGDRSVRNEFRAPRVISFYPSLLGQLCSFQGSMRARQGDSPPGLSKLSSTGHRPKTMDPRIGRHARDARRPHRPTRRAP